MSDEAQRVCARCAHPKRGHALPRSEGGHGGTGGACVVYSCGCRGFVPTEDFAQQEYVGDEMPKWVVDGAKIKVKKTFTTKIGIRASGGHSGDDRVWPGDVGTIERSDGIGWWSWRVRFSRGHTIGLDTVTLENFVRVR